MIRKLHPAAGGTAFLIILTFWTSTVIAELFGSEAAVLAVKTAILWGMLALIPAMAAVGMSGFRLGARSRHPRIAAKRRRMPVIAANGLFVLVPCAFFLQAKAAAGEFSGSFIAVQGIELLAGGLNLVLIGLSLRDGLLVARERLPRPA
ncbi:hypothetical protein J2R99_002420 [Rhodopseudomonas julia]|uniref:Transmembrane protein n=1 Tax=Rhodopseudomonas julia TaxID=200617 RepID=A0ABU0C7R5_9BRAD|nr:hypothetical protein [Rhodopseudomonas julia]MDQ0326551.1 hypothetical protein [Rhodopseudomonas julia]